MKTKHGFPFTLQRDNLLPAVSTLSQVMYLEIKLKICKTHSTLPYTKVLHLTKKMKIFLPPSSLRLVFSHFTLKKNISLIVHNNEIMM